MTNAFNKIVMLEYSGIQITVDNNNRTSYTTRTTGQYRCNMTNEVESVTSPACDYCIIVVNNYG